MHTSVAERHDEGLTMNIGYLAKYPGKVGASVAQTAPDCHKAFVVMDSVVEYF